MTKSEWQVSKQILSLWWLKCAKYCVKLTGIRRTEVRLVVTWSRPGTNSNKDDRARHERWHVGNAAELPSCSVVDADTGKDLRGYFFYQTCVDTDSFIKAIVNILTSGLDWVSDHLQPPVLLY